MRRILTAVLILATGTAWSQGILSRKGLGNMSLDPLSQLEMQQRASKLEALNVNDVRAAELLKKKAVTDNEFQKLRSRLPQSILKDSMDVMAYVKRSIFRDTLIYGSELFGKNSKLDFAPNLQIASSPSYPVGPGDQLELVLYGAQEATYALEVSSGGSVTVPYAGVVQASGLSLSALESKIRQRLTERGYQALASGATKLKLIVTEVRSIQVHVVGARKPGTYTVPAVATAMHVLYEAGGPGELGSYREIDLIRDGKVVGNLDLYAFMQTGKLGAQEGLRDGDILRIPVYRNRINLMGEFKRPGLYELRSGERLEQAIDYAGGFTEGGFRGQVLLFRVGEQELSVADIPSSEYNVADLREGDVVVANPLRNRYENRVAITGGVVRPGYYAWTSGMTTEDLIARAQGLDRSALKVQALLLRRPENGPGKYLQAFPGSQAVALEPNDSMYVPVFADLQTYDSIQVRGFVNRPGVYVHFEGLSVEQAILMAGGVQVGSAIDAVEVTSPDRDAKGQFVGRQKITLIEPNWTGAGTQLTPGATVSVRQRRNLDQTKVVYLFGGVQNPGGYSLASNGEPLKNLLNRVGPLKENAMPHFALVLRSAGTKSILVQSATDSMSAMPNVLERTSVRLVDSIAVDLNARGQLERFRVQNGDSIYIPLRLNYVNVRGAVKNQAGHAFVPGRRARYYLKQSGGFRDDAVRRSLVVRYANGRSAEVSYFMGVVPIYPRVYSNSTLYVQPKDTEGRKLDPSQTAAISSIVASISSVTMGLFFLLRN